MGFTLILILVAISFLLASCIGKGIALGNKTPRDMRDREDGVKYHGEKES